ncbi:MAG: hypothetical protein NVSMB42_19200 [Herpetosiphon sp.]
MICLIIGGKTTDDFDQAHERDRVEEVHANDLLGTAGVCRDFGDRDRRGIGGKDGRGLAALIQPAKQVDLQVEALGGGLDDQVSIGKVGQIGRRRNAGKDGCALVHGDGAALSQTIERRADGCDAAFNG